MHSKKLMHSLLPGLRRLFSSIVSYAAALADAHPMVLSVLPHRENHP
jgi:hypothetical protein